MTFHRSITCAALVALTPMSAMAGGLGPTIQQAEPVTIIAEPMAKSSANGLIVPAILAALVIAALVASENGSSGAKDIVTQ